MRHFNLVEASSEQSFAEIKTADGELTLTYEGEALAEGLEIFIVTQDGNVLAPDGEHMLEGDVTIVTKDGKIESIMETEAPAEEEAPAEGEEVAAMEEDEEEPMAEHGDEEEEMMDPVAEIADEVTSEVADEVADAVESAIDEEIVAAVADAVKEVVEEMKKDIEERMEKLEDKYATFSSAPASEKTIAKSFSKATKEENYKNKNLMDSLIAQKKRK